MDQEQFTSDVSIKDLLEAGAHFGHQKRRWNPKMKRFIFELRNGLYIIDLAKTMQQLRNAIEMIREVVRSHKSVMFVGTKKQAKNVIRECAEASDEFYVSERWLGGMLTNLVTIRQSIKKLELVEKQIAADDDVLTKKEKVQLGKKQVKLDNVLSGIRAMRRTPGLLIVVDPNKEHIAVSEANKLGIPVMALVDTNCNPDPIDLVIPCNDDALKSIKLILQALTAAIIEEKQAMNVAVRKGDESEMASVSATEEMTQEG